MFNSFQGENGTTYEDLIKNLREKFNFLDRHNFIKEIVELCATETNSELFFQLFSQK